MSRLEAEFNKDMYSMLTTPCGSRTGQKDYHSVPMSNPRSA